MTSSTNRQGLDHAFMIFDESLIPAQPSHSSEKQAKPKAKGTARCPGHRGDPLGRQLTGIVALGTHWVWRVHTYRTEKGHSIQCGCSSVAICVAPPVGGDPTCPCQSTVKPWSQR